MIMPPHLFVTGTDTEVGKTRISVALIKAFVAQGEKVLAMKPIASGCQQTLNGWQNPDAIALMQAASVTVDYDRVNPFAFPPAIAPHIAAQQCGVDITLPPIQQGFTALCQQADRVIVEGAGGWFVPLNRQQTLADLAQALAIPVVLVVAIRLGCINHALLTVEAIVRRGLPLYGWVANCMAPCDVSAEVIASLTERIDAPCLGVVPMLATNEDVTSLTVY